MYDFSFEKLRQGRSQEMSHDILISGYMNIKKKKKKDFILTPCDWASLTPCHPSLSQFSDVNSSEFWDRWH